MSEEKERDLVYYPDYEPNKEDDDEMLHIKEAVGTLNSIQKKIFLTYCEIGTYSGLAREFGVSVPTAKHYIMKIKEIIYDRL